MIASIREHWFSNFIGAVGTDGWAQPLSVGVCWCELPKPIARGQSDGLFLKLIPASIPDTFPAQFPDTPEGIERCSMAFWPQN